MVYISGSPVMFVGCGQSYTDLKKLNVKAIIKTLLKWVCSSLDECLLSNCCSLCLSALNPTANEYLAAKLVYLSNSVCWRWISPLRLYVMIIIVLLFLRFLLRSSFSLRHSRTRTRSLFPSSRQRMDPGNCRCWISAWQFVLSRLCPRNVSSWIKIFFLT
jgi:hypothetical protein